jgi:type IV pilus assembly protein PilV
MRRPSFVIIRRAQRGVALLEALLAVVLLGIGLIGTLALQTRSVAALSEAGLRAEATIAANDLLGVMNTDQANLADYAVAKNARPGERLAPWYDAVKSHLPGATIEVTVTPAAGTTRTAVGIAIGWQRTVGGEGNVHKITSYLSQSE